MTIALLYVRQSRHKSYERTVSPEVQEEACRALREVAACDEVVVYSDLDTSGGKTRGRLGYLALVERIKAGGVSVVAAYDQSRAFRNTTDALAFYALMERHPDIAVAFAHGRFDRSAVGGFTYTTLAAAHEMERRMTGEKIKDAKRRLAEMGQMVGAVPAGYRRVREGVELRVEVVEESAAVVRRIFEEYATGTTSTRQIARRLNAEGVRLPSFRTGWRADTVAQILGNRAYIGQRNGRAGTWPALVPVATFETVQRLLGRFKRGGGRRDQRTGEERRYAWQGLLVCGACGGRLQTQRDGGVVYYRCRGNGAMCGRAVREDALDPWGLALMEWLESRASAPAWRQEIAAGREPSTTRRAPDALASVAGALDRLGKRFEWGHITDAEYRVEWGRLEALRAEVAADVAPKAARLKLEGLVEGWQTGDALLRRELLAGLFIELVIRDKRVVSYRPHDGEEGELAALLDGWDRAPIMAAG